MFDRALYFARIGRVPAVLNFTINALIGLALFARRDLVPWTDAGSVGADLLVGGCIVATISAWAATPGIERDSRAGLVAGRAASSWWRVLPAGRVFRSVLLGVFIAIGLLLAIVPPCESAMQNGISGYSAALFKGVTSLLAGQIAIVLAGNRVLVGAPNRVAERAAIRASDGVPLAPIAKACLAGTSQAHGASVAPTWRLTIEGEVTDEQIALSFERMAELVPVCRSVVRPVDGLPEYAREFVWSDVGAAIELEFGEGLESVRTRALNHHIDLFESAPVRVCVARESNQTFVFVQQHHAVADGRAFIEFLGTWAEILEEVRVGQRTERPEWSSRPEAEAFDRPERELSAATWRGTKRYLRESWARFRRPPLRFVWNTTSKAPGDVRTLHVSLPDSAMERIRALRADWGAGTNSVISAAYVRAARSVGGVDATRVGCELMAETRPRDGSFRSFANHLSVLFVRLDDEPASLKSTAVEIHRQVRAEVASDAIAERALFRGWAARRLPIDELRKRVLDKVAMQTQLGFSNLTALAFPRMFGAGWRVSDVRVTTPTLPPHALVLTAVHYADTITFNFNYDSNVVEDELVGRLASRFVDELSAVGEFEATMELSA